MFIILCLKYQDYILDNGDYLKFKQLRKCKLEAKYVNKYCCQLYKNPFIL